MRSNTLSGAIMARRKIKYYLSGNGYDTWDVSILHGKGRVEIVKQFNITAHLVGLDRQSERFKRKRNLYYIRAKVEAEDFLKQLEATNE